jgi:uncharacterized membrane protein YsdA (DUF1294 family)
MQWWMWVILFYLAMSVATLIVYAIDKRRARLDLWRIRERTLHLWALLGGWPGAFVAMKIVRHKGSKRSFVLLTWVIAALHAAGWGAWLWLR